MTPSTLLNALGAAALVSFMAAAQTPTPAPPKEPEYVTTRDFKTRLFPVLHRDPYQLKGILRPLTSGFKGVAIEATEQSGMKALSVRDFPENLAAIEEALKRLDVAAPARKEVELHIHVLYGSRQDGPAEPMPDELKDVVATLKGTLAYRSYTQAISFAYRAGEGSDGLRGRGFGEGEKPAKGAAAQDVRFDWQIRNLSVEAAEGAPAVCNLKAFTLEALENGSRSLAYVMTDLSLKDGEKVVVGTSAVKDKGLIVVVTAKVLK